MGFDLSLYSDWLVEIEFDRLMAIPDVSKHMIGWSPTRQVAFLDVLASFDLESGLLITEDVFAEVETVLKHLPGRHDQRSHGHGRGKFKEREKSFDQDEVEILAKFERLDERGFFNQPTEPNFFGETKIEKEFSDDKDDMLTDYEAGLLPPPDYQKAAGPSWQEMVAGFSKVMAIVHLAMRMNEVDIESLYDEMYKARKTEFDDAVSDYLAQMDCGGKAYLKAGPEMKLMKAQSRLESEGIANTYNRDLAKAILNIKNTAPSANRYTYVSQLRTWEAGRRIWKMTQIALHTIMTSRDQALKAFSDRNGLAPDVELYPRTAAEPICQGWINRGIVSYQVAKNNPSPYHVGCLHYWRPKFVKGDCSNLWIG